MKPRETRQSVMVPVRIRRDAKWMDASIRNVSTRGMMLQMEGPPPKGSYIEIRRAQAVMIGQVRWVRHNRCGVRTQDIVPISYLLSKVASAAAPASDKGGMVERRAAVRVPTPAEAAERARIRAMLFQKASLVAAGIVGAAILVTVMYGALSKPLAAIAGHLR